MGIIDRRLKALEERAKRCALHWVPRLMLIAPSSGGRVRVQIDEWDGKSTLSPHITEPHRHIEIFDTAEDAEIFADIFISDFEKRTSIPLRDNIHIINICR